MAYVLKKIMTDNPFVDYIVYYSKYLVLNCITKNETRALSNETKESYINYQCYFYCDKGTPKWELWESFFYEDLKAALSGKYNKVQLESFANAKSIIPEEDRPAILEYMKNKMLRDYEELNDYYREIEGYRPSTSSEEILLSDFGYSSDEDIYLHKADHNTLVNLDYYGILDQIINAYPDEKWIKNIKARIDSDNKIGFIQAREADDYDLLYVPDVADSQMKEEFINRYNNNRLYVLNNIYSDAFKLNSDYYDNFIQVLILVLTMLDMLEGVQDHVVRRDILEVRCIQYIFEQYSIPYYDEIPIKYQIAMMKNIHKLLKFKSTARCMIDLCSLFGFPSSRIFQLYLMKNRKVDQDGNFIFNYIQKKTPINVGKVEQTIETFNIITENSINLDFPVSNYFDNGNILEVWVDDKLLSDEFYTIYDNILYFENINILRDVESIKVRYYYDQSNQDIDDVGDYKIIKHIQKLTFKSDQSTYELKLPIDNFFNQGGIIKVIHGTLLLPETAYDINIDERTITFTDRFLSSNDEDKYMEFIYFYSNTLDIKSEVIPVEIIEQHQTSIPIPEPYSQYYSSGSRFFLSVGGTYITSNRYHVIDNTLIMNSAEDAFEIGQHVFFHFIYSNLENIEIITKKETVIATEHHQRDFHIPLPYTAYLDEGNPIYVKVRGNYLPDKYYTISKNMIRLKPDYSLYEQGTIEFIFIYAKSRDIKHTTTIIPAFKNYQQDFQFEWPYTNFLSRGNKLRVVHNGNLYIQDIDYCIKGTSIEILTVEKSLNIGDELRLEFFYNEVNENIITIEERQAKIITENQLRFPIDVPFYRYFSSGNDMIVTVGSTYVSPSDYTVSGNTLIFNNDHVVELSKDRMVNCTFIYHTIYNRYNSQVHKESYSYDIIDIDSNTNSIKLPIPYPFENYIELGNEFEIRLDGSIVLDKENYEVINNEYVIILNAKQIIYEHHSSIQFVFIYSCTGFDYEVVEDVEKDCELKFIKVPLLEAPDKYFKEPEYYVKYDDVALHDETWSGEYSHEYVKQVILYRDFNYTRTKYFSITNMISMCEVAYQVPYFMNIILDNLKLEESLVMKVPYINKNAVFKFNDVITFMMALSHRYIGIDDGIPTIAKALYIKGFNFEADMSALATYIEQKMSGIDEDHKMVSDKYKSFIFPKGRIPTYKELIKIYTTNTEIYDHVVHEMINADNKMIFDIYKKIYESLMMIKESKDYFKIGRVQAKTITEWIKYRDSILHDQLVKIDDMKDEISKKKLIIEYLEACNYELEQFLDKDVFKYFLASFAGNDADALTRYLRLVINFFKSYKIQLYDVNTHYVLDDKLENTLRAIDYMYYHTKHEIPDEGHNTFDVIKALTIVSAIDSKFELMIREKLEHIIREYVQLLKKDVMKTVDFGKYLITMLLKDKVVIEEILKFIVDMSFTENLENMIDDMLMNLKALITPKDYINIKEHCLKIIREYALVDKKDYSVIAEEVQCIPLHDIDEDIASQIIEDLKVKVLILMSCSEMSGLDQISRIHNMFTLYDILKIEEKIKVINKIYEILSKRDQVSITDIINSFSELHPNTKVDIPDKLYTTIQQYLEELSASGNGDTIKSNVSTVVKDYHVILDYLQILIKEAKALSMDEEVDILDQIKEYILSYQYQDLVSIEDILMKNALYELVEDASIEDGIFNTLVTSITKDVIAVKDHIQILKTIKQSKLLEDVVDIYEDLISSKISIDSKEDIKIIDRVVRYILSYRYPESVDWKELLNDFKGSLISKDKTSLVDYIQTVIKEAKTLTVDEEVDLLDILKKYNTSIHHEDTSLELIDKLSKYNTSMQHEDYTSLQEDSVYDILVTSVTKDKVTLKDYLQTLINGAKTLSVDEEVDILGILKSYNTSIHYEDTSPDLIDKLSKYSTSMQHEDYTSLQEDLVYRIKEYLTIKDKVTLKDYLQTLINGAKTLSVDEEVDILGILKSYNTSIHYEDTSPDLIDKLSKYNTSMQHEDYTSLQEDSIYDILVKYISKDAITVKDYMQIQYDRLTGKIIRDIFHMDQTINKYNITTCLKSYVSQLDQIISSLSTIISYDTTVFDDSILTKSSISYTDDVNFKDISSSKILYKKPTTIQDVFKIHDSLTLETID